MAQSNTINVANKPSSLGQAFNGQPRVAMPRGRRSLQTMNAVKEVFMPALSSTMTEGKIVSWLKSPGDKVKKGESIVVVESGESYSCNFEAVL
jgi:pyruvate dehydrogenase E2 component (dihydrolipoamide acetyltransferase)